MGADFAQKSENFKQWFLSFPGASISSSIDLADYRSEGRGRGVVALEDIPADTELFTIDPSSVLSVETSELFSKLPEQSRNDLQDKPWPSIILVLIYEFLYMEQSKWFPYITLLPEQEDLNTLMYWVDQQLEELQASAIRDKIGREDADVMFYNDIVPVIRANGDLFVSATHTTGDILFVAHRMATIVMSYAFDLETDTKNAKEDDDGYVTDEEEASQQKAMVPLADLLNADADFNAHLFNDEDGLKMRSTRDIKKGEEIMNDFGTHPRAELLRRYGYITDKYTKYDVAEIPLTLVMEHVSEQVSWDKKDIEKRLDSLEEDEIAIEGFMIDRGDPAEMKENDSALPPVEISAELIEFLHAMLADPQVWKKWRKKLGEDEQSQLRTRVFGLITEILEARSRQYPTSIEEDKSILARDNLSRRMRMAIEVRLGEKQLLREAFVHATNEVSKHQTPNGEPSAKRQKVG